MDALINLYAKMSGIWSTSVDFLPLIGAAGSILIVFGSMLSRVSTAKSAAEVLHSLHPTNGEMGQITLAIGLIKAHFNHLNHASEIQALKAPDPVPGDPPK